MKNLKQEYIHHINHRFADFSSQIPSNFSIEELIDENLLSSFVLELPKEVLEKLNDFVGAFNALRESPEYSSYLKGKYHKDIPDPGNKSLFMSYDFHLSEEQVPKLIEINTNASFLALGFYFYELLKLPLGTDFNILDLKKDILEELGLNGRNVHDPKILIIDETPEKQKLYIEFLVYQSLFRSFGWNCQIVDYRGVFEPFPDLIYNRWTDFYFEKGESKYLDAIFKSKKVCFSPNPFEYFLQADKQRLVDLNELSFWEGMKIPVEMQKTIRRSIPLTQLVSDLDKNELWNSRKNLFFKPTNSFGSKQTYKGASISRRVFEEITTSEFIAQEYVGASERIFKTPAGPESFKFDLRCYAYRDKLQMVIGRLYKGQVTNLKTPYGGFCPIKWI